MFTTLIFTWPLNALITSVSGSSIISDTNKPEILSAETHLDNTTENVNIPDEDPYVPTNTAASTNHTSIPAEPNTPRDTKFYIEIPKVSLKHDIAQSVDPTDPEIYLDILETKVAHGKGTSLPQTSQGNTYLFAHSKSVYDGSTPSGGWFTRIDELTPGDSIIVYFYGKSYSYIVTKSFTVDPSETYVYTGKSLYDGKSSLTLQTCYPRGNTDSRLIVQAVGQ